MDEHRKELEKKTKPIMDTLRSYQDLPSYVWYLNRFSFFQDKTLASLAIEEKRSQYATVEKYLEEVLHSSLATSE
ncbi:hypothetical protein MKX01_002034 [Papaver californicum]|nr:hypothetical protein MKX01_002034 [Papaver californicum]